MSAGGYGPPIDELDYVCRSHKDCVKCAFQEYGDKCYGEMVRYSFSLKDNEVQEWLLKKKSIRNYWIKVCVG